MRSNPLMAMESYPDECWTYDDAVALVAFKVADRLDGTDHTALCRQWVTVAKEHLVDKRTGLLLSSYQINGEPLYGPEGSTIWMVAHCLQAVDEPFARDQYERARKELGRITLGFGYGLEWPASWQGPMDVDSGMVVPGLGSERRLQWDGLHRGIQLPRLEFSSVFGSDPRHGGIPFTPKRPIEILCQQPGW